MLEPQAYGYPKCYTYGSVSDRRGTWRESCLSDVMTYTKVKGLNMYK